MNEENESLIPVSATELAILEAMAMVSDFRVIDFKSISDKIDERAEKVEDGLKDLIRLMSLVYVMFECEKSGRKEVARKISDELDPEIAPLAAEFLDDLEEDWRKKNE